MSIFVFSIFKSINMKYRLLFILLALLMQVPAIFADDEVPTAKLTFVVDDADRVAISISGEEINDLQTGSNTIDVMQWSNISISPKAGCTLKSVVNSQNEELAITDGEVTFMVYEAVPETYTITSEKASEVNFTIDIDNPAKVTVADKDYQPVALEAGVNNLTMSELKFPLIIASATYGQELYQVLYNNEEVKSLYGSYSVSPEDNSVIKIITDFPDIDCKVDFTYPDGITKFFTAITVNGTEVSDFNNGIDVKCGDNVALYYNPSCWDTEESPVVVKINDIETGWFGPGYSFVVKTDTKVAVEQALAVEMITVSLEADNPANIEVYRVQKFYNDRIYLTQGENTIELPKEDASLVITNVEMEGEESKITGITINGTPETVSYYNEVELKDLDPDDIIKIFTEGEFGGETPVESVIIVEPESGETLKTLSYVTLNLEPDFYYDDEDLFEVNNIDGIYFTLNGERFCGAIAYPDIEMLEIMPQEIIYLAGEYQLVIEPGAISWIREKDGDFVANSEALIYSYTVEGVTTVLEDLPFTLDPAPAGAPVASLDIKMTLKDGYDELDVSDMMTFIYQNGKMVCGVYADLSDDYTSVTITPEEENLPSGTYDLVFKPGAVICEGDDSYYNIEPLVFTYVIDTNVGVNAISSEADKEGVFNLLGIKVADTPENLPAGIYVVNGKKIIIK